MRRLHPAGEVCLPAIGEHRLSMHLSHRTPTACRGSGLQFVRRRGQVDITPAHSAGGFEAFESCEAIEVRLPVGFLERVAELTLGNMAMAQLPVRHLVEEPRLTHLLLAIEAEHAAGSPGGRFFMDSLGMALAVHVLTDHAEPASPMGKAPNARQVQRAVDFIEAHLDRPLSLHRIASVAGMSISALQRSFRSLTGDSVHRYVVRRRVERARMLLAKGSLPASEVALTAGFSHQSHMARWMRRILGITPGEIAWRR